MAAPWRRASSLGQAGQRLEPIRPPMTRTSLQAGRAARLKKGALGITLELPRSTRGPQKLLGLLGMPVELCNRS